MTLELGTRPPGASEDDQAQELIGALAVLQGCWATKTEWSILRFGLHEDRHGWSGSSCLIDSHDITWTGQLEMPEFGSTKNLT